MTLFLSFRYQPVGGGIRPQPELRESTAGFTLKPVKPQAFADAVGGRDLLLAIHGYNVSEANAVCALTRLETGLALPASARMIGALWPGDSSWGVFSYPVEKPTATAAGGYLARYCDKSLADAASLSFVTHSLGARVALEAVRRMNRETKTACLMAAAIERNCLESEFADAFAKVDRVCVLASRKDNVLALAFPLGNLFGQFLEPSALPVSSALGLAGPPRAVGKTIPPWQIPDSSGHGHGHYLPPSTPGTAFPDPDGKWNDPVAFARRTFENATHRWPG